MGLSADRVEEIVRQVLQELQAGRIALTASAAASTISGPASERPFQPEKSVAGSEAGVLRIPERAVTEGVLQAAGAAGRTVSLVRGAVLTPSGRDYVRRHNVRLSSSVPGMGTGSGGAAVSGIPGVLTVAGRESTARAVALAAGWTIREVVDEFSAAGAALEALSARRVVCVGVEPAIAACVLNRNGSVRAAVLERAAGMERILERMQPHVVCLQSSGWSHLQLSRLLAQLQRPVQQPSVWTELHAGALS